MNQPLWSGPGQGRSPARPAGGTESASLADILERVLDKGIVIAGDIRVNLLDIELLTIKIRLIVASVDRAREMGIDWWEHDPALTSRERDVLEENRRLRQRLGDLEGERDAGKALDGGRTTGGTDDGRPEGERASEPASERTSQPEAGPASERASGPEAERASRPAERASRPEAERASRSEAERASGPEAGPESGPRPDDEERRS
jgi:hypothetical protein